MLFEGKGKVLFGKFFSKPCRISAKKLRVNAGIYWFFLFHPPRSAYINIIIINVSCFLFFPSQYLFYVSLIQESQCSAAILFWKIIFSSKRENFTVKQFHRIWGWLVSPFSVTYLGLCGCYDESSKKLLNIRKKKLTRGDFEIPFYKAGCTDYYSDFLRCLFCSPLCYTLINFHTITYHIIIFCILCMLWETPHCLCLILNGKWSTGA